MSCPYLNQCSDETIKCKMCTHNEERSHYVEYHEYPSPTSIEWPYLPSGDDLRFPLTSTWVWKGW